MKIHVERFSRKVIIKHDLSTHECFERQRRKHIEAEAETGYINNGVIGREVIEDVPLGVGAKGKESSQSHEKAGNHGDDSAKVSDASEAVYRGLLERTVNQEGVMVADKGWMKDYMSAWFVGGIPSNKRNIKTDRRRMGRAVPNDMTPIAWNIPLLIVKRGRPKLPLESAGTRNPWVATAIRITSMLINAKVLALANYSHSHH